MASAFQLLLSYNMKWRAKVGGLPIAILFLEDANSLELPFRDKGIFAALKEMNSDKGLCPEGFTMVFCLEAWCYTPINLARV